MITDKAVSLNYNEERGLEGILSKLTRDYPFITRVILYGSKARGDFLEDSDLDLLVVTESDILRKTRDQIYDVIYTHELSNDIVVSAIFVSEPDFREKLNPFLMRVKKEGLILWSRE